MYDPSKGRFRGYLKVCTFRALRNRLRNNAKIQSVPLEEISGADTQVDNLWNGSWEHELLNRAISIVRLEYGDGKTFRAFDMHVLRACAVEEVSAALEMSVSSVYKAKQRITVAIQRQFQALLDEEG